ncbi:MAG: C40 family peptidase [Bacteroidales bacterium]|nr:C40 family peptidase [Bacteroidales bacterium]
MSYGVCLQMAAPLRAADSHRSEMVSQLLFGETYSVLETTRDWLRICVTDCEYEGWISIRQHTPMSDEEFNEYIKTPHYRVINQFLYLRDMATTIIFPIALGSQFPIPHDGTFQLGGHQYAVELPEEKPLMHHEGVTELQERLLSVAFQYLNAPYLWGGRTPAGIDCSGFVQNVFASIGIILPRDASQQVSCGQTVDFIQETRIGDVAFFQNEEGNIVHTGIICGFQQIIHSCGYVQINTIDETGIYHQGLHRYTHQLRIIKRLFD